MMHATSPQEHSGIYKIFKRKFLVLQANVDHAAQRSQPAIVAIWSDINFAHRNTTIPIHYGYI